MVIFAMDKKNDDSNTNITDSVEPAPVGRQHEVVGQHYNDDDIPDRESNRSGSSSTSYNYPGDADIIMEIDMTEIKFQKVIGKGSFGVVYRALWAGKPVAVKKVETDTEVTAFQNEITQLSRVRHDNIIQMYGIGISLHAKCIIMEYANDGSLYQFLHCPPHRKYNLSNALSWLLQCAKAIAYLHSIEPRPIIHRDLKPLNLLLTNGRRVLKVCDFGTACDLRSLMTDNRGSTAWMAPEAIKGRNYNEKCDVYSWGLIMWELLTRRIPFEQLGQTLRIAWQVVVHRVRPPLIQGCPKPIERLMERCWQDKQSERPSMQEVVDVVYPLYRIMSGSEGDNLISSCYSSENSTAEGYASPLNGESTADHTSCDVSQITSSNNTFDYPPDVCKAPGQIPTPSSGAHLGPNSPYLHPDQGGPSRLGQGEGIGSRECWRVHPPDSISPDASANVLVGVENLLPPWGSAKSDDMPTSPASPAPGFLPPRRAFKGVKFPAEPILPLSISIPNGLHGLHPSEPFTSPWTFPVITAPHPILRPAPPTLTQAFAPPPHPPHIVSPPPIPEGTRVSLRPHSAGHDPSVVARRRSAEVPHSPHRGHRRSSSCESFELIGFEPLANELSRESRDAARSRLPFKSPVRTKDKFLTPEFGHMDFFGLQSHGVGPIPDIPITSPASNVITNLSRPSHLNLPISSTNSQPCSFIPKNEASFSHTSPSQSISESMASSHQVHLSPHTTSCFVATGFGNGNSQLVCPLANPILPLGSKASWGDLSVSPRGNLHEGFPLLMSEYISSFPPSVECHKRLLPLSNTSPRSECYSKIALHDQRSQSLKYTGKGTLLAPIEEHKAIPVTVNAPQSKVIPLPLLQIVQPQRTVSNHCMDNDFKIKEEKIREDLGTLLDVLTLPSRKNELLNDDMNEEGNFCDDATDELAKSVALELAFPTDLTILENEEIIPSSRSLALSATNSDYRIVDGNKILLSAFPPTVFGLSSRVSDSELAGREKLRFVLIDDKKMSSVSSTARRSDEKVFQNQMKRKVMPSYRDWHNPIEGGQYQAMNQPQEVMKMNADIQGILSKSRRSSKSNKALAYSQNKDLPTQNKNLPKGTLRRSRALMSETNDIIQGSNVQETAQMSVTPRKPSDRYQGPGKSPREMAQRDINETFLSNGCPVVGKLKDSPSFGSAESSVEARMDGLVSSQLESNRKRLGGSSKSNAGNPIIGTKSNLEFPNYSHLKYFEDVTRIGTRDVLQGSIKQSPTGVKMFYPQFPFTQGAVEFEINGSANEFSEETLLNPKQDPGDVDVSRSDDSECWSLTQDDSVNKLAKSAICSEIQNLDTRNKEALVRDPFTKCKNLGNLISATSITLSLPDILTTTTSHVPLRSPSTCADFPKDEIEELSPSDCSSEDRPQFRLLRSISTQSEDSFLGDTSETPSVGEDSDVTVGYAIYCSPEMVKTPLKGVGESIIRPLKTSAHAGARFHRKKDVKASSFHSNGSKKAMESKGTQTHPVKADHRIDFSPGPRSSCPETDHQIHLSGNGNCGNCGTGFGLPVGETWNGFCPSCLGNGSFQAPGLSNYVSPVYRSHSRCPSPPTLDPLTFPVSLHPSFMPQKPPQVSHVTAPLGIPLYPLGSPYSPVISPLRSPVPSHLPRSVHSRLGGNWINEELGSSFEGPADEPTGPQAPHSASPYCLAASYSPEVAAQSRDVPSSILVASSGADTPLRINPPHFAQSPTKLGGDPRVPEEPAPSPHHEGTVPPTNTEREELGAFWQLLDDDLKPTMPHPTSPQSQQIFQEHKGLAHQLLVVQEEIVYLDKEKKRLLTKLEDQDREQQSCRQRYTDKIIQLKNKNESLRHDHSRLSQQLEEIRGRQKKEQASSPDSQPQLHHQPSSANSPVTLPSYFPPQHVQGGGQVPLQQQQHVPQPQYYYGPHHHHLYPYTHNP